MLKFIKNLFKVVREKYILYTAFGPIQRKWLIFLKNNPDKQFKGALGIKNGPGDEDYKVCCLGQFGLMTGICEWREGTLYDSDFDSTALPHESDMIKFGFRDNSGRNKNNNNSLAGINDGSTWLDVYNACLNDPKGYFTKKV